MYTKISKKEDIKKKKKIIRETIRFLEKRRSEEKSVYIKTNSKYVFLINKTTKRIFF